LKWRRRCRHHVNRQTNERHALCAKGRGNTM